MGRPSSELYRGVRLAGAVEWAEHGLAELTGTERAFLAASAAQAEQELRAQARSNRRLRLSLVGVGVLLIVALVAGVLAIDAARRSERQAEAAADAARLADSRRLSAQALAATEPDLSLLLALEGVHLDDSNAARSTIYSLLGRNSQLRAVARASQDLVDVEVAHDGKTLLTSGQGGITRYDASTLEEVESNEQASAEGLALSPGGRHLAYAFALEESSATETDPRPVRLLDPSALQATDELGGFMPGTFVLGALGFSADGRRLAAGFSSLMNSNNAGAQVWDLQHPGRAVRTIPLDGVRLRVALSPDGGVLYAATRGPDVLRSYDVRTGRLLASHPMPYLSERTPPLVLSPDGSLLATSHRDGTAVLDARKLDTRFLLPGLGDGVSSLAFSGDGTKLASGFVSGTTIVSDMVTRKPVRTLRGHSQPVEDVAFGPGGRSLYTVGADRQLLSWVVAGPNTFPPARAFSENPENGWLAYSSPDGRTVAYVTYDGQIQFRDVASGRLTRPRTTGIDFPAYFEIWWTVDSRHIMTSGGSGGAGPEGPSSHTLEVWDRQSGRRVFSDLEAGVDLTLFTSDNKHLIALSEKGSVTLRDRETLEPVGDPIAVGEWNHEEVGLTPDNKTLYLPLLDGEWQVVDLSTGEVSLVPAGRIPYGLWFSPDGDRVATFDAEGRWGVLAAEDLGQADPDWVVAPRKFNGPNEFYSLTWSADGSQLITFGPGTIDLWDARTLGRLGTLTVGAADQTPAASPLPDGHTLLITHPAGQVVTWDLRPQHLVDVACDLAGRNLTKAEWSSLVGTRTYRETCPDVE